MSDLAFYNAGCHGLKGPRKIIIPFRRLLRRILRPIFYRQVELFQSLGHRIDLLEKEAHASYRRDDKLNEQLQAAVALGWDYVATVRRLAVLEDRVEALMARGSSGAAEDEAQPSIPFPDPESTDPLAKVS